LRHQRIDHTQTSARTRRLESMPILSSIGRTDAPFLISSSIYGGDGCPALRANGIGIIGLETSFESGGVRTFGFGPLTGTVQITLDLRGTASQADAALWGAPSTFRPAGFGNSARLKQPGAPAIYRENSSCTQRRPIERPFSVSADLARLSRRMQECARRSELSSPTCASPQEALSRHRQAPTSSTRLVQAEKLLLWGSWLPPVQATPRLPHHCKPDIFGRATPDWARRHFLIVRSSPQCGSGPARSATAPRARLSLQPAHASRATDRTKLRLGRSRLAGIAYSKMATSFRDRNFGRDPECQN
jgi:hypothetical protein